MPHEDVHLAPKALYTDLPVFTGKPKECPCLNACAFKDAEAVSKVSASITGNIHEHEVEKVIENKKTMLIGLNNSYVCNSLRIVKGDINEPSAFKTWLGWVVHRGSDSAVEKFPGHHKIEYCTCDYKMEKLNMIVSVYMSSENVARKYELASPE
ncbi:hypothetical protein FF38_02995 [Lucilia cuprina]|uniref:Uncharacterized protein n=1 Tax=Lucilia cuprina TaxID=7375 RepID=A0A0L0BXY9_LUCCU|nr:hypothetical protein FF38_02995 [Lucilia cuprina]